MTFRTERDPATVTVTVDRSSGRATPEPAERRFRGVLHDGANALLAGVESATSILPGGAIVSAAVHGATSGIGSSDQSGSPAGDAPGSLGDALGRQADTQMQYIELQQRMQDENRRFTTLSNVLKARHETAKTAIGNIR